MDGCDARCLAAQIRGIRCVSRYHCDRHFSHASANPGCQRTNRRFQHSLGSPIVLGATISALGFPARMKQESRVKTEERILAFVTTFVLWRPGWPLNRWLRRWLRRCYPHQPNSPQAAVGPVGLAGRGVPCIVQTKLRLRSSSCPHSRSNWSNPTSLSGTNSTKKFELQRQNWK